MPARPRTKMSLQNRAKQFLPFAALKGFEEALAEKERIRVPKPELSEDVLSELSEKLHHVRNGQMVSVVCYSCGEYIHLTGMVTAINKEERWLRIVHTTVLFDCLIQLAFVW